jgi:GxxExxY protein
VSSVSGAFDFLTDAVIGAAIAVHEALGPGLLETTYEACLEHELKMRGRHVDRQKALPATYRGLVLDFGYRVDLLVDDAVIIEVKAVERLTDVHEAQLLTYLRLSGRRVGLLLNFNVRLLKRGIRRLSL